MTKQEIIDILNCWAGRAKEIRDETDEAKAKAHYGGEAEAMRLAVRFAERLDEPPTGACDFHKLRRNGDKDVFMCGDMMFAYEAFKYCPYCGRKLEQSEGLKQI
jgi:hypothetical protein